LGRSRRRFQPRLEPGSLETPCVAPATKDATTQGYRIVSVNGVKTYAHRVAWETAHGPIPKGMCVCHHCDNPPCIELTHLFLGTKPDNNADMVAKGRQARGERIASAKLTEADVRAIRALYAGGGLLQRELAHQFGIAQTTVSHIVTGECWGHVR